MVEEQQNQNEEENNIEEEEPREEQDDLDTYMQDIKNLETDFSDLEDLDLEELQEMQEAIAKVREEELVSKEGDLAERKTEIYDYAEKKKE